MDLKDDALRAARRMLRPILRILLRHGVMHSELVELSKEIYVDIARHDYGLRGRPTNVSRVALLTGLGRREATRVKNSLDAQRDPAAPTAGKQDRIARVLAAWYQDPAYLDNDGKPKILPLQGPAPSYQTLIQSYGGDVPAITLDRELRRVEAVRPLKGDRIQVLRRNYRVAEVAPEALDRAGSVLADLGATVGHNLYHAPEEVTRFERRATNINVPTAALPAYREFVYAESQQFLEKVDGWLTRHEADDGSTEVLRLGIGMYWIQDDQRKVAKS